MYSTVKHERAQKGYSLIELAISLIVVGVLAIPAVHIYSLHVQNERMDRTETSLTNATSTLGGFRSLYGRYPCPAARNVGRGDPDYGYEECDPVVLGIVPTPQNTSGDNILIGTLPFRTLLVPEEDAHDGHGNRLTYAVTEDLTDETTFTMTGGGIGVVDADLGTPHSLISPEESAHFVVLSHNNHPAGAWTKAGVQILPCNAGSAREQENCDDDATFMKASMRDDFDDRVFYMAATGLTHWQIASADENDIHLRRAQSFTVGLGAGQPPPLAGTGGIVDVINFTSVSNDASIKAAGGVVLSQNLCEHDGTGCFPPTAIYGLADDLQGIDCDKDFLVGIEKTANAGSQEFAVCLNQITLSCPPGKFFGGMNMDGTLICDSKPLDPCPDASVMTTCGDLRPIEGTYSGGYSYAYSGECYRLPLSDADIKADVDYILSVGPGNKISQAHPTITIAQSGDEIAVETYIAAVNALPRIAADCGETDATAQVRDSFKCHNGSWGPHGAHNNPEDAGSVYASEMAHEALKYNQSPEFPDSPMETTGDRPAEITLAYAPNADPNNVDKQHDCWCREDYSLVTPPCAEGLDGMQIMIKKHICPQSFHNWKNVYENKNALCGCVPGIDGPHNHSMCYDYFGVPDDGTAESKESRVSGNVEKSRWRNCDANGKPVFDPWEYDTSQCKCHEVTEYEADACPAHFVNNFEFNHDPYENTEFVTQKTWDCPNGDGNVILNPAIVPNDSATDAQAEQAGEWGPQGIAYDAAANGHPCLCQAEESVTFEDCPAHLSGPENGVKITKIWDCNIQNWGPEVKDMDACYPCVWTPTPPGNIQFGLAGEHDLTQDTVCNCGEEPSTCYKPLGGNTFEVWSCQCKE